MVLKAGADFVMNGFWAVFLKEFAHIRRDWSTVFFTFVVPALQMTIFGYAIKVTIDNIPMVILDLDGRQESRRLVEGMCSTRSLAVTERAQDLDSFGRAIRAGRAKVGVLIPADYSEKLLHRQQAQVQVLVDGSDSQVATTAMNVINLLVIQMSQGRAVTVGESMQVAPARSKTGAIAQAIDARTRVLYNPDLESSHFFVPGLIGIILQLVLLFLTSFSIVREREFGTLEQLFVTPVGRGGLLFGKLMPYSIMAFGELLVVLTLMVAVFGVSIVGSLSLLLVLCGLFIITVLGLGLLISTIASTQLEAIQFSFIIMLPSVLLSGFIFPRSEMPIIIRVVTYGLPVTYFIEILRGLILRGADLRDLLPHIAGLSVCCITILTLAMTRFRKQLD